MNTTLTRRRDPSPSLEEIRAMSDKQAEAVPIEQMCDAVYAEMEHKEALLTVDQINEIEHALKEQGMSRRTALLLLTEPWASLENKVCNNREYAISVAFAQGFAQNAKIYKGLAELMTQAAIWAELALGARGDAEEIQAIAEAENEGPTVQ